MLSPHNQLRVMTSFMLFYFYLSFAYEKLSNGNVMLNVSAKSIVKCILLILLNCTILINYKTLDITLTKLRMIILSYCTIFVNNEMLIIECILLILLNSTILMNYKTLEKNVYPLYLYLITKCSQFPLTAKWCNYYDCKMCAYM